MVAYRGRLLKCVECSLILDRDVVAVLNLQMWGSGATPKALLARLKGDDGETVDRSSPQMSMKVYQP